MRDQIALPLLSEILVVRPVPKYDRRLSDKILAAFAHAYEVGELSVASSLRRALEQAESSGRETSAERRLSDTLYQADLLVEFVDARAAYKRANERKPADPEEVDLATREMIEAYRRWSDS